MRYCGRGHPYLPFGGGALVRPHPEITTKVLVQFDDFNAVRNGVHQAFGWHEYPAVDFVEEITE